MKEKVERRGKGRERKDWIMEIFVTIVGFMERLTE